MTPREAKLELQRQAERLGYVGDQGAGLRRLLNTIDAAINGTYPWDGGEDDHIVRYIGELSRRPTSRRRSKRSRQG